MKKLSKRQKEIVDAALKIISRNGLQNLTIKALAKEIKVTEGALYRHFKSKEEIVAALVILSDQKYLKINKNILQTEDSTIEKLRSVFFEKCLWISQHPEQIVIINSRNLFKDDNESTNKIRQTINEYKQTLIDIISEGQKKGEFIDTLPPTHLYYMAIGGLRLFIDSWERKNYSFNLVEEGQNLWNSVAALIVKK